MNHRNVLRQQVSVQVSLEDALIVEQGVDEQMRDVDTAANAFDTLDSVQTALESIATSIRANTGAGLDPRAAQFLRLAMEQQYSRVGLTSAAPALESFNADPRRAATLSLEEVEQKSKTLWESIKGLLARVKKFIVDLWNRLFKSKKVEDAKKEAEEAKKATEGKKAPTDATMSITVSTYNAIFTDEGTTSGAINGLEELVKELLPHVEGSVKHMTDTGHIVEPLFSGPLTQEIVGHSAEKVVYAGHLKGSTSIAGQRVKCTGTLPGHRQFWSPTFASTGDGFEKMESAFSTITLLSRKLDGVVVVEKARPLTTEEIGRVSGHLDSIAASLTILRQHGIGVESKIDGAVKTVEQMAEDSEEQGQHEQARLIRLTIKLMVGQARGLGFMVNYLQTVAEHFGHFCKMSAAAHDESAPKTNAA